MSIISMSSEYHIIYVWLKNRAKSSTTLFAHRLILSQPDVRSWLVIRHIIWSWNPNTELAGYSYIAVHSVFVNWMPNTQPALYSIVAGYSPHFLVSNPASPTSACCALGEKRQ